MAAKPPVPRKSPAKPKRPANLPHGRWLGDFEPLSEVERQLVEHCAHGTVLTLGNERPEKPLATNKIRGGIIRFLLLGGDEHYPVHEKGVMIEGVWVRGTLDLRLVSCPVRLFALSCVFDSEIDAFSASIPSFNLAGSSIPGLNADGIKVRGSLVLRRKFAAAGPVRVPGAEIGGDLDCSDATFHGVDRPALFADRIIVNGSIFLASKFRATGEVRLLGAEIGGNLDCADGYFSNEKGVVLHADRIKVKGSLFLSETFHAMGGVRMLGAQVGGNFDCSRGTFAGQDGYALNLDGSNIRDGLFLRGGTFTGDINLTTVFAGTLIDDQACYKDAKLLLDGFQYDRVIGPIDAAQRIDWLMHQRLDQLGVDFKPQPWEHLIRVLRDMGHPSEAAQIAIAKQKALRDAGRIGLRQPNPAFSSWRLVLDKGWSTFSNLLARWLHWFYGWIAGYGHRPTRIVWRILTVCALWSLAYYGGRASGLIGPSAPVLQIHPALARCGTGGDHGAAYWTSTDCPMPPEYSTFQPFVYSLDVIIPFVDLHQESEWGPVVANARGETLWWGRVLRLLLWIEIIFGWIASVMFVAIIGRLVDKD
jgi:hypothetical protein